MSADDSKQTERSQPESPKTVADAKQWRPVGFRGQTTTGSTDAKKRPRHAAVGRRRGQPIASRPKSRIFTGLFILLLITLPGLGIWNGYFRYAAQGVVRGRVVRISAPWQGTVAALHVREGDPVKQGQPVITLRKLELEHELESINDKLRLAQAELKAQAAQWVWQAEVRGDRSYKAWGEYYEAWAKLMQERAVLDEAIAVRDRHELLYGEDAMTVSERQLESYRYAAAGQGAKVEKLEESVKQLKQRAEMYERRGDDGDAQMNAQLMAIEALQAKLGRLREQADEGIIRSPVNGYVVRLNRFSGEVTHPSEPAIEIVEDGSLEIALYVPQRHAGRLEPGSQIEATIEPHHRSITCVVERQGRRLEPAPANIERYYYRNARLLPVIARPTKSLDNVYLGSKVTLSWSSFFLSDPVATDNEFTTAARVADAAPTNAGVWQSSPERNGL